MIKKVMKIRNGQTTSSSEKDRMRRASKTTSIKKAYTDNTTSNEKKYLTIRGRNKRNE